MHSEFDGEILVQEIGMAIIVCSFIDIDIEFCSSCSRLVILFKLLSACLNTMELLGVGKNIERFQTTVSQ